MAALIFDGLAVDVPAFRPDVAIVRTLAGFAVRYLTEAARKFQNELEVDATYTIDCLNRDALAAGLRVLYTTNEVK